MPHMSNIPPIEILEQEFSRYIDHPGVLTASSWNQPNFANPLDEEACLERSAKNSARSGNLLGDEFFEEQ